MIWGEVIVSVMGIFLMFCREVRMVVGFLIIMNMVLCFMVLRLVFICCGRFVEVLIICWCVYCIWCEFS